MDTLATAVEPSAVASPTKPRPHAVVIGSGFGGLAAGIRLGARGYRVTVLEKLDAPGGRAYTFHQDGFSFDAGPTMVTAPFVLEELWSLAGRRFADDVTLKSLNPFYIITFADGTAFRYGGGEEAMKAEIARFAPGDEAGYARFMKASSAMYRIGFEDLGHMPFSGWLNFVGFAPKMVKLGGFLSVYRYAALFVKNPKLRIVLSFHPLFIGGDPFKVTSVYALVSYLEQKFGVHYPMGGIGALVGAMAKLVEDLGGAVRCNAEVTEITVKDKKATGVRLASGETIEADVVVSNADSAWTYRHLVPASARPTWSDRRLERARYSPGVFLWYFGLDRTYPEVGHHTISMGPRYKGLLRDIFDRKVLAPDFSFYLHRNTATDPSLAPEGCDGFYCLVPVPNLTADIDWATQAEPFRRQLAAALDKSLLPGFEQHVITSRVVTPVDFRDRLLAVNGAAFSLEPVLTQTAWFRPRNKSEDVEGLYLVGAGTHPGAGIPGVLSSARVLDRVVPDAAALV